VSALDALTRPRTLAVLLAVSLGLNLFLAGGIAGRFSAGHRGEPGPSPMLGLGGPGMDSGFRFIPREGREHMRSALRERRPGLRDEHEALRRLHREIADELRREAPDRALIERRFEEIRGKSLAIEQSLQAAFLDAALSMDPVERTRMLDEMLEHRGRPLRHGPHGAGRGDSVPFEPPLPPPGPGEGVHPDGPGPLEPPPAGD
jgi:uncharacterized membrane protein